MKNPVMETAAILFLTLSAFVGPESAAISWTASPDEVDGYRIYKGDVNSRVFVGTTSDTKATVDVALERPDAGVSTTISNKQLRGAYLFAGSKGADVKFKSMVLAE